MTSQKPNMLSFLLPKKHGAWSILISTFIIGSWVPGPAPARSMLLCLAILTGFVGQHAIGAAWQAASQNSLLSLRLRQWGVGLLGLAGFFGGMLIGVWKLYWMLPLGVTLGLFSITSLVLEHRRKSFTFIAEFFGVIGLSCVVLMSAYISSGTLNTATFSLWFLCVGYFTGTVFHVRFLVRNRSQRSQCLNIRIRAGLPSLIYHTLIIGCIYTLSLEKQLPELALITIIPAYIKVIWGIMSQAGGKLRINHVGVIELINAVVFVSLVLWCYR